MVYYSFAELYVYLAKLRAQEFCIQLPRQEMDDLPVCSQLPGESAGKVIPFNDAALHFVMEYCDVLYTGERLSALSGDLPYWRRYAVWLCVRCVSVPLPAHTTIGSPALLLKRGSPSS